MKKKSKRNPSPVKLTPAKKKALASAGKRMMSLPEAQRNKSTSDTSNEIWAMTDYDTLVGKKKSFSSPQDLWKKAKAYFEHEVAHPTFSKQEWKAVNGKLKLVTIKLPNVFTIEGLCGYLSVSSGYFRTLQVTMKQDDPDRAGYLAVIAWIKDTIYKNKFRGSSNGSFNATFLAYDMGLRKDIQSQAAGMIINVENNDSAKMLDDVKRQLEALDNDK